MKFLRAAGLAVLLALCPVASHAAINTFTTYFPLLPYDAPPDAQPSLLPLASNIQLEGSHADITRGIIIIHDFSRDAGQSLATIMSLAGAQNDKTVILAPQFLLESDIARFAEKMPDKGRDFARWTLGGWGAGDNSLAQPAQKGISSYTAIDLMLMYLADPASFPDMKDIIVIGHGEGGDFVQRYAAAGQAPEVMGKQISLRFAVLNASSYLYLTTVRPQKNRQGFAPPDDGTCKDFNQWPYGTDNLNAYAKRAGVNAIKMRFASRQVGYLVGENASKNDPAPDTSCAALLQGADRPSRAMNYDIYTGILYGEAATKKQNLLVEPNTGYDATALYGSKCGMTMLFGDGDCTPALLKSAPENPAQ